jgi:hypothetical protein
MDRTRNSGNQPNRQERSLAQLKILSRLLGHELHAQNAPRLTFSRDEVVEIQTSLDIYIEETMKNARGSQGAPTREVEMPVVEARVN